jgi:transcriptional regulator with GAF, ATPase, and Fis domain
MPANDTVTLRRDPPLLRPRPRIAWRDAAGDHEAVVDRPLVVGSASQADVVVQEATVSRLHAELDPRPDGLWVRDLGSRNGTYVAEVQVTAARVPDLACIRLGAATLRLQPRRDEVPVDVWPEDHLGQLLGGSAIMRELFATIVRIGASEAPVLVEGETGTGKELVARAIHDCSHRATGPFVIVDCAALPEGLLESELFGHAKGAFTGATATQTGSFESAEGGTVFLDEIGELPLSMQPKLLRVLESRMVRRIGESTHRRVDVRFVTATHRNLRAMVNGGEFREDLYFRLAVLPVRVPPLREREEDVPRLVELFAPSMPAPERVALCQELAGRQLAGNVRELRNLVERASLLGRERAGRLADEGAATPDDGGTGEGSAMALSFDAPFRDFQHNAEREYLQRLMVKHGGHVAEAAQAAGINRTYFYRLLRKHAL